MNRDQMAEVFALQNSTRPFTPRVLVAVNSCWRDKFNGSNQAIRETWATQLPEYWDLQFFLGDRNFTAEETARLMTPEWIGSPGTLGNMAPSNSKPSIIGRVDQLESDEVLLECSDQYLGLPFKTVESLRWALARKYPYILRVFTDTYLFPERMDKSGFEEHDAIGWSFGCGPCPAHPTSFHSCPLGGAGYWLSAPAARAVITEPIRHWGEDTHVGFGLQQTGMELFHDRRYIYDHAASPLMNRSKLTIHLNDRGTAWNPKLMYDAHLEQEAARSILPNWEGTCKRCQGVKLARNPRGLRCAMCGEWAA